MEEKPRKLGDYKKRRKEFFKKVDKMGIYKKSKYFFTEGFGGEGTKPLYCSNCKKRVYKLTFEKPGIGLCEDCK